MVSDIPNTEASLMVGIVSYLPNELSLRQKRTAAVKFQDEWLNKILPLNRRVVVAQNYGPDEVNHVGVNLEYIRSEPLGAGEARNVILREFYHTEYDWLLLLDDDTIIDEKYSPENFINEIMKCSHKFDETNINAISALEPEYHPYKKQNYEDKNNLDYYKFIPRELNSGSATSLIRNVVKLGGQEVYFPNVDANKGEGREDMEFLLQWLLSGYTWYTMVTWIRKSLCFNQSSIFGIDTKARDKILMHDLDVVCDKYKKYGLQRGIDGRITWANFNNQYNKSEKVLYVKREQSITFDPNVIPKEKEYSKKLF